MDENLWYLIIKLICLVFILLLFLMSCCVRNRDFTRSYVLFVLIPMTIQFVARFINSLDVQFPFLGSRDSSAEYVLYYIIHYASITTDFSLATGTIVFLIMSMVAACGRQEFGCGATWFPFFLTATLSFVLGFLETYFHFGLVYRVLYWLLMALFAFCIVLIVLIPFVFCCCASSNPGKSSSPVVYNAKSRLGWAFVFAIFALFPPVTTAFYYELQHLFGIRNSDFGYYFLDFIILAEPIIFVLAAIFFLPAYRTVFFCSSDSVQDYRNPAVTPIQPANNFAPQPVPSQQPLVNQPPQTFQQQQIDENLAAYLMNPNQLQNLANQLTVPTVSQCPNCKYPPIHVSQPNVSHPQMMQQQPLLLQPSAPPMTLFAPEMMAQQMPMQTMVQTTISHNHQPMVQSNLVRFASQPNLVQFNTMQPAYSMPQLASAQSPFVVQQ